MSPDPDCLAARLSLANQWALWRARSGEGAFLLLVVVVAIGLALMALESPWQAIVASPAPWKRPAAAALAGLALAGSLWWSGRAALRRILAERRRDWLAALPIAAAHRETQARRVAWRGLLWRALACALVVGWLSWRSSDLPPLGLGLLAGCLVAALWARWPGFGRLTLPDIEGVSAPVVDTRGRGAKATAGLALLGVAMAPVAVRVPRLAWPLGLGLLLVPVGARPLAVLGFLLLLASVVLSGDLIAALRRRLAGDRGWLAALPLAPPTLLAAYAPTLWRAGLVRVLLGALGAHLLGAPAPWMLAAAGLLALGMLHGALLAFAARAIPARFALWSSVHAIALLGTLQVLPPIVPLAWLVLLGWSWRRATEAGR